MYGRLGAAYGGSDEPQRPTLPYIQTVFPSLSAWEVTYGVWHPRDELVFAREVQRLADLERNPPAFDELYKAWSIAAAALGGGVVGGVFLALTKAMGIKPETVQTVSQALWQAKVPNPTTSRPATGLPDVADNVAGWYNLQPYDLDPTLLPTCRVSPEATRALYAAGPTRANLENYLTKFKSIYACANCVPSAWATDVIAHLEADIRRLDIESGRIPPTASGARVDVNASPLAKLAQLRGAPVPTKTSSSTPASTSPPSPPPATVPTGSTPLVVGGLAALLLLGYAWAQRSRK